METIIFEWLSTQSWFGLVATIVVAANAATMTLKDSKAVKIPYIGKIWPTLNYLALNIGNNKNKGNK